MPARLAEHRNSCTLRGAVGPADAPGVDTYSRAAGPTIEVPLRSYNKQCEILAHHSVQVAESNWPPIAGSKFP